MANGSGGSGGATIRIHRDIDRYWKSVYRPILCSAKHTDNDVAYCRAELYIESIWDSGNFVSTGILIDGHEVNNQSGIYYFNLMEHCRHFVGDSFFLNNSTHTFQLPAQDECKRFYLQIWPVRYSGTIVNALWDDYMDSVQSNIFAGVSCTTHDTQAYEANDHNFNICSLVLGDNGWLQPLHHQLLTEMPGGDLQHPIQTINRYEDHDVALYTIFNVDKTLSGGYDTPYIMYYAFLGGVFQGLINMQPTLVSEFHKISLHPDEIEAKWLQYTGSALNLFVDASGNLICDKVGVYPLNYSTGGHVGPTEDDGFGGSVSKMWFFDYTEEKNDNHCQKTKFVFKNHLGGYDWFNCYGTITKKVKVSGTEYDQYFEGESYQPSQAHSGQMLWTEREDEWSVFSQPLTTEKADWLADLVVSPKVWIEERLISAQYAGVPGQNQNIRIPVIIKTGSYKLHTTEDNVHYMEYKYKKSQPRTTQRN